jgi:NAD(P)-dependent dehydrogenase (short-subunit alcohol dehydrogenase family)
MTAGLPQATKDSFIARTPMARPGYPREVAEAVVSCATLYGNSFKNGNIVQVTGGM